MRIFLIGFTASGKTTIGKQLAGKLGLTFFDIDQYIEKKFDKPVSTIFSERGESHLRLLEMTALHSLLFKPDFVLSTGGGTPCFYDNMRRMNNNGITIYLEASVDELFSRLKNDLGNRPLLQVKTEDALKQFIEINLANRKIFYEKAHIRISSSSIDINKIVDQIRDFQKPE